MSWIRPRQAIVADGLLALVLGGIGVAAAPHLATWQPDARHPDAFGYALVVIAALSLVARRIRPLVTLTIASAATTAYLVMAYAFGPILVSLAVAVYTAAARLPARRSMFAATLVLVALLTHVAFDMAGTQGLTALAGALPALAWVAVPLAFGQVVRAGREAAARSRAEEVERYSYQERLRIAQEVHDVVGHGLAAITMQAEIALHVLPKQPEQAGPALAAIGRTSKEALDELRATLRVVRHGDDRPSRTPEPGLTRLDDLIERASGAGVTVNVIVSGESNDLPSAVDLAAYRIVQESLTNVLRHARTTNATVHITHRPLELSIDVTDNGRGSGGAPATSGASGIGHGITGMRERAAALGGAFEAGPRLGGGFRVHARLPLPAVAGSVDRTEAVVA